MIKAGIRATALGLFGILGVQIISPTLDLVFLKYRENLLLESYRTAPISDFVDIETIRAKDITTESTQQQLQTVANVKHQVRAFGEHKLICLVDGEKDDRNRPTPGANDHQIYSYDWNEPWTYFVQDPEKERGWWDISIKNQENCESREFYWKIPLTFIFKDGHIRKAGIHYSEVFLLTDN